MLVAWFRLLYIVMIFDNDDNIITHDNFSDFVFKLLT